MKKYWILSAALILFLIGLPLLNLIYKKDTQKSNIVSETEPKPKLPAIEYTIAPVGSHKKEVKSLNYGFSFVLPDRYEISRGGGFDKKFPLFESQSIDAREKDDLTSVVYVLSIHFLNGKTPEEIANEQIESLKKDSPTRNPNGVKINKEQVNGQNGISYRFINPFGGESFSYLFAKGDLYYSIGVSQDKDPKFTSAELNEIKAVVESLKFF